MSVRRDGDLIRLEGACPVEEAETLAALLLARPKAAVEWSGCTVLHTAVVQVLLRLRPRLQGSCGDPFAARWLAPVLAAEDPP
ncbi:hypothetical protein [Methylobacterium platani]|uniref:STAS domain-containing protein n=2 Tax=Methylobacterium platani TaxID=427683 RepID=A0A179S744_9HYPH|nr:hypothetical protein [Methylobacterium platani]KMO11111.1 hypothetical protein SQ03_28090 [Methylobacterium platani JCM 14648]OAS21779.1 hypothetical protein A5481_20750 [Methylobacterium platani]